MRNRITMILIIFSVIALSILWVKNAGGNFWYSGVKRIKNCSDCHLPHIPEYDDTIMSILKS